MTDTNHAQQNACGWMDTIREYMDCLNADRDRLQELRDEKDDWIANLGGDADEQDRTDAEWGKEFPDEATELAELVNAVIIDGEELDEDACRDRIMESPLSVQVRGGWHNPGDADDSPEEFEILLSTGGPALRIIGELDEHCEPTRARLEYQDWGTPWTEHEINGTDVGNLMQFVNCFYFGD